MRCACACSRAVEAAHDYGVGHSFFSCRRQHQREGEAPSMHTLTGTLQASPKTSAALPHIVLFSGRRVQIVTIIKVPSFIAIKTVHFIAQNTEILVIFSLRFVCATVDSLVVYSVEHTKLYYVQLLLEAILAVII